MCDSQNRTEHSGEFERFCHVSRHLGIGWWRAISLPRIVLGGGLIAVECVSCGSAAVTERRDLKAQGYHRFRCRDCGKQFNERTHGVLNCASLPSDIIAFMVFCRLRYRLTLRDLSEHVSASQASDWPCARRCCPIDRPTARCRRC